MEKQYAHIVCDTDLCAGCGDCELACSIVKHGAFNPSLSRIRTVRIEPIVMSAVACRNCSEPPCVLSCPRNALTQDPEKGIILVDDELCDGCAWCIEACEFGAILLNTDAKKVEICDLCPDYDEPQCIVYCEKNALSLSEPDVVAQKTRRKVVRKLLQELTEGS